MKSEISDQALGLLNQREALRKEKRFGDADKIRVQLEEMGYRVMDTDEGAKLVKG